MRLYPCISADSAVQFESVRRCFRNAERILDGFKEFQEAAGNTPELQEIYNELKFEFEYYR